MTVKSDLAGDYAGRRVLVTGHTGFKGAWLGLWLQDLGARVAGFSDRVPTTPAAYDLFLAGRLENDLRGDVRDAAAVAEAVQRTAPEIIFHLAAQPIVRAALADPLGTFASNVLGTVAVLEAARALPSVRAVVVVTSDKVYRNDNTGRPFRETDPLGGHEPYGASKAAAEIAAATYRSAGFHRGAGSRNIPAVATARAGNVIGGGDWAADRLIPDTVRAVATGGVLALRSPRSIRPWQHVLEPLCGYLMLARALLNTPDAAPAAVNFGPLDQGTETVADVIRVFLDAMAPRTADLRIEEDLSGAEATMLRIDSALAQERLGWAPAWDTRQAVLRVAEWHRAHFDGTADLAAVARAQIAAYCEDSPVPALRGG